MDAAQLLRGIGRGATADVVGGPMDMATTLANLLVAGGGYAGHKLGLLENPPDLIDPKNVPLTSDWFAKGTPLAGEGREYDIGRVLPALAGAGLSAMGGTKRVPGGKTRQKQAGALYRDKKGNLGGEDFALYHNTDLEIDPATGELPKELRNLSMAITQRDKFPVSSFGHGYLVPRPQAFEPRTSPTVIKSTDFYTPRRMQSFERDMGGSSRVSIPVLNQNPDIRRAYDTLVKAYASEGLPAREAQLKAQAEINPLVAQLRAQARLADKSLHQTLPFGGAMGESLSAESVADMIKLKPEAYRLAASDTPFSEHIIQSPRFSSFEEFVKSPKGAGRIGQRGSPTSASETVTALRERLEYNGLMLPRDATIGNMRNKEWMAKNASMLDPLTAETRKLKPAELNEYVEAMRKAARKGLDYGPSQYAEVKRYGPTQLNSENFVGYISDNIPPAVKDELTRRGIQSYHQNIDITDPALFELMEELQTQALRGRGPR